MAMAFLAVLTKAHTKFNFKTYMHNKYIFILTTILIAGLSACEKTEKVDNFPKHEGKLVTNCFFNPDTTFIFKLSKSLSPIDNAPFRNLNSTKAILKIYENNVMFDSLVYGGSNEPCYLTTSNKRPKAGNTYRFECNYPGLGTVTGEDYLPDTTTVAKAKGYYTILNSYYDSDSVINGNYLTNMNLELSNNNPYLVITVQKNSYYPGSFFPTGFISIYEDISDLNANNETEYIYSSLYVSNPAGIKNINLKWTTDYGYINKKTKSADYKITIYACSKNVFEYLKRQAYQIENQDDPFSQPTPISNNIVNGYGIFGGINVTNYVMSF